jgi:hypothetical protein
MHERTRPLPHTSRQPGDSRHLRRVGDDLTVKLDRPGDWMGLNSSSR